jgi:predicted metal-binding protein
MARATVTVAVCRGCCCGNARKHPGFDHEDQVRRIQRAADGIRGVQARVVKCLDECERSNVVMVRRQIGPDAETYLLGDLADKRLNKLLLGWLAEGCAGEPPEELAGQVFNKRPGRPALAKRVEMGLETSLTCPVAPPPE